MSAPDHTPQQRFRAVLAPHRSLSSTGFAVLMLVVAAVNFVTGAVFLVLGAWPVLVFCGLEVLLVYVAFRLSYRDGRARETIEIGPAMVTLTRTDAQGREQVFTLNSYWARIRLNEHPSGATELKLASHGREWTFARFLSDDERRDLAAVLDAELRLARDRGHP